MAVRDKILDGLAWASLTEQARVARISAALVRELGSYTQTHTKTRIKEAVRNTSPPYGRAKFIVEAVTIEYQRQLPIYRERKRKHDAWKNYQEHMAKRATRLNHAYAAAFDRPPYLAARNFEGDYNDWDARQAWNEAERAREKGDEVVGLTHQDGYVVALVSSENGSARWHIATRLKKGPIVRTYLRRNMGGYSNCTNLVEAAVSLGGPKVRSALALGKKVVTDWVGRRTYIHHEGQDHQGVGIETVNWRIVVYENRPGYSGRPTLTACAAELIDGVVTLTPDIDRRGWSDT